MFYGLALLNEFLTISRMTSNSNMTSEDSFTSLVLEKLEVASGEEGGKQVAISHF